MDYDGNGMTRDTPNEEIRHERDIEARLNGVWTREEDSNKQEEVVLEHAIRELKGRYGTAYDTPKHEFERCVF